MKTFFYRILRRLTGRPLFIVTKDNSPLITFYIVRNVQTEQLDFHVNRLNDLNRHNWRVEDLRISGYPYYPGITTEPRFILTAKITMPINSARSMGYVR